jgi:hypothetical protein
VNVDERDKDGLNELAESLCFVDVGVVDISRSNSLDNLSPCSACEFCLCMFVQVGS